MATTGSIKLKKTKITIRFRDSTREIEALTVGYLAIHRDHLPDGTETSNYIITHIPTGMCAVRSRLNYKQARVCIAHMDPEGERWNFIDFNDVDPIARKETAKLAFDARNIAKGGDIRR